MLGANATKLNCKAHPDEKGTERIAPSATIPLRFHCKAHPDEKGTESSMSVSVRLLTNSIARPIPMKRELKAVIQEDAPFRLSGNCKAHPDEKGTER